MKINNLTLKNFLSFKDDSLDLGGRRLALILGKNNDTTSMDSNGSGKSVLLEGIVWGLFGKTFRGLKGDKVVNTKAEKDCQVSLTLSVNGSKIQITRYRRHTIHKDNLILEIDGKEQQRMTPTETQELLENTIHMNYATFMATTVFPEGSFTYLASMADADRKDLLESVAGITSFDGYQRKAKDRQKGIQGSMDKLTTNLIVAQSSIEAEIENKASLARRHTDFTEEKKDTLMLLDDKIRASKKELETIEGGISCLNLEEAQRTIEEKRGSLKNLEVDEEQRQHLIQAMADLQGEVSSLAARKNELEVELLGLRDLKPGQKCPLFKEIECKQMTEDDIREYLEKIQARIQGFEDKMGQKERERLADQTSLAVLNNQRVAYMQVEETLREDETGLRDLQKQQLQLAPSRERILVEIQATRKEAIDTEKKASLYISMIEESERKFKILVLGKEKMELEVATFEEKQKYIQFWVEGFSDRGLKSFLLDSVIQQLNERTNYYLAYLTDGQIRVDISTRTTLKSGEEREKLHIKVYSDEGMQEYDGCSSGERRRVDVSSLLALRELAKARLEQTFDLLFVDEVFDKLDQSGIERVVHLLTQQTNDDVFVISHDASLMDVFENVIMVERTDKLSRIVA